MEEIYIPNERSKILKQKPRLLKRLGELCECSLSLEDSNCVRVDGDGYGAYNARNVVQAFGRGFGMRIAELLLKDGYYFSSISLRDITSNKNRIKNMKARLIGRDGKAKRYMESVSGALIAVYGDTVSFIGSSEAIEEAEAAARSIMKGSSHRLAYNRMEASHRKHKGA
jgi:ribosomal RNA assembly protein